MEKVVIDESVTDATTEGATDEAAAEEDAQFQAAFEEGTAAADPAPAGTVQTPTVEAEALPVVVEPPAPTYKQLTTEEHATLVAAASELAALKTNWEQKFNTAFGSLGGLNRIVKEIQDKTPKGEALVVSEEDFEELRADFPELAALTAKGLNRALSKRTGTGAVNVEQIKATMTEQLQAERVAARKESALEMLDTIRPDWRAIVGDEKKVDHPYRVWMAAQPVEYRQKIDQSWRPGEVLASIKAFETATAKTPKKPDSRTQRLLEGVQPRGDGGPPGTAGPKTEQDEFNAGFEKELRSR